ncbi:MAG TPA: polysaccharide deacetylase family protein, partial [Lachnospiraceae bacterium]|nr:polysaccharide deacetylase family protein [Lachnospiraceae bacterium]
MMQYQVRFPQGKKKAFTLSYDDGQVYDRKLVDLFDRYGLRATFHLNSGTLGIKNETDEFLRPDEIEELFDGHEISCHGVTHPFFSQLSKGQFISQIWEDRRALESYAGYPMRGMSYPYGEYSKELIAAVKELGMEYARTVEDTMNFSV